MLFHISLRALAEFVGRWASELESMPKLRNDESILMCRVRGGVTKEKQETKRSCKLDKLLSHANHGADHKEHKSKGAGNAKER
jgi:hypothetical protein